jgi:predicted AAA+ superfamily ATPase
MLDVSSFQIQNPWRVGTYAPEKSFRRHLRDEILPWLADPDILVIVGSRQVGKTTLLFQIIDHLFAQATAANDIFYFNLDDLTLIEFFDSPVEFLKFVELHKKDRGYVFIDEVQRLKNPGLFLKYIYDLKKKIKLIVSGSSSLEIQAKISESLTGRKQLFHLYPFSFGEFVSARWSEFSDVSEKLNIHDRESFSAAINKVLNMYQAPFDMYFSEYVTYGGYPRVVLEEDPQRKILHLREIFTSYLQKDVKDFFRIENISAYNNLLKILANQIGNLVNISELANTLGLHKATVEKYLHLLEGTFMFKRLTPFFRNVRRELSKMPKIYALDLGMRNFAAGNFGDVSLRGDRGEMAENFVFTELQRQIQPPGELYFWRTQTKAEVDLIIELPDHIIPVEVKYRPMQSPQISRSFRSFLDSYGPAFALVFTKNYLSQVKLNETEIIFLPLWALLFFKLDYFQSCENCHP